MLTRFYNYLEDRGRLRVDALTHAANYDGTGYSDSLDVPDLHAREAVATFTGSLRREGLIDLTNQTVAYALGSIATVGALVGLVAISRN